MSASRARRPRGPRRGRAGILGVRVNDRPPRRTAPAPAPTDHDVLDALAHQLGSSLGAIVNGVHLLGSGGALAECLPGIEQACANARAQLAAARRWLAALEAVPRLERVEPGAVLGAVAARLGLGRLQPQGPLPAIRACPALFERQVEEVLDNARRHGGARVQVTVGARALGEQVELWLADDGPGWTPEAARAAFRPLCRMPGAPAGPGGPGVGLAIVAALAARQGGAALGRARPGQGAEVCLRFAVPA